MKRVWNDPEAGIYFESEYDRRIADAKAKVNEWDKSKKKELLLALMLLQVDLISPPEEDDE